MRHRPPEHPEPHGRYFAELVYRDENGKELQREEVLFNHDTAEEEQAKFGQVYGQLDLKGGARGAAIRNTRALGGVRAGGFTLTLCKSV